VRRFGKVVRAGTGFVRRRALVLQSQRRSQQAERKNGPEAVNLEAVDL
jgi:hypothetical protein